MGEGKQVAFAKKVERVNDEGAAAGETRSPSGNSWNKRWRIKAFDAVFLVEPHIGFFDDPLNTKPVNDLLVAHESVLVDAGAAGSPEVNKETTPPTKARPPLDAGEDSAARTARNDKDDGSDISLNEALSRGIPELLIFRQKSDIVEIPHSKHIKRDWFGRLQCAIQVNAILGILSICGDRFLVCVVGADLVTSLPPDCSPLGVIHGTKDFENHENRSDILNMCAQAFPPNRHIYAVNNLLLLPFHIPSDLFLSVKIRRNVTASSESQHQGGSEGGSEGQASARGDGHIRGARDPTEMSTMEDLLDVVAGQVVEIEKLFQKRTFFFSYDCDLTRSLQEQYSLWKTKKTLALPAGVPVWSSLYGRRHRTKFPPLCAYAESRFVWNYSMIRPFKEFDCDLNWVTPVIQGAVSTSIVNYGHDLLRLILIGRRSAFRGGTRYFARGLNDYGDVANFCETEIRACLYTRQKASAGEYDQRATQAENVTPDAVEDEDYATAGEASSGHSESQVEGSRTERSYTGGSRTDGSLTQRSQAGETFYTGASEDMSGGDTFASSSLGLVEEGGWLSLVQLRGSVPVYWEQNNFGINPQPKITGTTDGTLQGFIKHQERLQEKYGRIHYLDLLSTTKQGECRVSETLQSIMEKHSQKFGSNLLGDDDIAKSTNFDYTPWDFHKTVQALGFENAIAQFVSMEDFMSKVRTVSYFHAHGPKLQNGVIRTNCLDCLDRTNVVQWLLSDLTLHQHLSTYQQGTLLSHKGVKYNQDVYGWFLKSMDDTRLWVNFILKNRSPTLPVPLVSPHLPSEWKWREGLRLAAPIPASATLANFTFVPNCIEARAYFVGGFSRDSLQVTFFRTTKRVESSPQLHSKSPPPLLTSPVSAEQAGDALTDYDDLSEPDSAYNFSPKADSLSDTADKRDSDTAPTDTVVNVWSSGADNTTTREVGVPVSQAVDAEHQTSEQLLPPTYVLKDSHSALWADLGDLISVAYTGTGSVLTPLMKSGRSTILTNLTHLKRSVGRLYKSNFEDKNRQECIDLLLGLHRWNAVPVKFESRTHIQPLKHDTLDGSNLIPTDTLRPEALSPDVVSPDSVSPNSVRPDSVRPDSRTPQLVKTIQLDQENAGESPQLISSRDLHNPLLHCLTRADDAKPAPSEDINIWVGTWNTGGGEQLSAQDLTEWLCPLKDKGVVPDIYVVTLQEVV